MGSFYRQIFQIPFYLRRPAKENWRLNRLLFALELLNKKLVPYTLRNGSGNDPQGNCMLTDK